MFLARSNNDRLTKGRVSNATSPWWCVSSPASMDRSVDLPAPLAPIMPVTCPALRLAIHHAVPDDCPNHRLYCDQRVSAWSCHCSSLLTLKIRYKNTGAPISAVTTPSFSSALVGIQRTAMSAASNKLAPPTALANMSCAGSFLQARRSRCGTTKPTKPMMPVTATPAPTHKAVPRIILRCVVRTFMPRLLAVTSPRLSPRAAGAACKIKSPARQHERAR